MRVPDHVAFLRRVAPVLEQRLAQSAARGYTGALRLQLYTGELSLRFAEGGLDVQAGATPNGTRSATAAIPAALFPHLLMGHKSLDALLAFDADCIVDDENAYTVLSALFPGTQFATKTQHTLLPSSPTTTNPP